MEFRKEVQELAELIEHYMDTLKGYDMAAQDHLFEEAVNVARAHQHLTSQRDITFFGYFPNSKDAWEAYAVKLMDLEEWSYLVPIDLPAMERMHGDKLQHSGDYYFFFP